MSARRRRLGFGLIALSLAMAVNSVLGPLLLDLIEYPVSELMLSQTVGLDAATLVIVAPAGVLVGGLVLSGYRWAPLFALAPTSYAAYMFVQYVAGPDHLSYPPVLILQLAIFVSGWMLFAVAWRVAVDDELARELPRARVHGIALLGMAAFVGLRYLPALLGSVGEEPLPAEARGDPAMYWLILLMDVGIFVPVATVAGLAILRDSAPWGWRVFHAGLGWFLATSVAVGAMSLSMLVRDDPEASVAQLGLFLTVAAAAAVYAMIAVRSLTGLRARGAPS